MLTIHQKAAGSCSTAMAIGHCVLVYLQCTHAFGNQSCAINIIIRGRSRNKKKKRGGGGGGGGGGREGGGGPTTYWRQFVLEINKIFSKGGGGGAPVVTREDGGVGIKDVGGREEPPSPPPPPSPQGTPCAGSCRARVYSSKFETS